MRGLVTILAVLVLASCALKFPDKQPGDTSTSDAADGTDLTTDVADVTDEETPADVPVDVPPDDEPDETPDGTEDVPEDTEVEPGCGNGVLETSLDEECDEGTGLNCDIRDCTCTTDCRNVWIIEHADSSITYLNAVWASGTDAVTVGNGGVSLVRDPSTGAWSPRDTRTTVDLNALTDIDSGADALAAGDADTLLHWDGSDWSPFGGFVLPASGDGDDDMYDVLDLTCWRTAPYRCLLSTREGALLTYSGTMWDSYTLMGIPWMAVGGAYDSGEIYGYAGGRDGWFGTYHSSVPWDWSRSTPIGTDDINDIWVEARDDLYVAQDSGRIHNFSGGGGWGMATSITIEDLHGIILSGDFIFSVGDAGTIISLDRSDTAAGWIQEPTFVDENLRAVVASSGLVFAVGQDGIILRRQ